MTKPKAVNGWSEIPDETIRNFEKAVLKLAVEMLPEDADGDLPVQILLVDRRRFEKLHYCPVPYDHKAETSEAKRAVRSAVICNVAIAASRLDVWEKVAETCERDWKREP